MEASEVQFSKHAQQRVEQRGIEITDNLINELNTAVSMARSKGSKDLVVIDGNGAFIVNVPNKVVVTAISGEEMKDNVFTNIDSAVII
jgi:flagellar operon protein